MKRRKFIKVAGNSLAGLVAINNLNHFLPEIKSEKNLINPHDEKFWSLVREHFPLTKKRIYLNTGGLGASPHVSIEALKSKIDELEEMSETGHSHELWLSIKEKAAKIFGCDKEEIAYTRNTTEGVNIVCNGFPFEKGDEVITSTHEHVGNIISWIARQKRDGIKMRVFEPSTKSARENIDRIEKLINKKTRALSISHVTTATGQVLPVNEIGELAKSHNLLYFIDGAQSAGMLPINVHKTGCHAYATSGHKWLLGPKGTGLLYVRKDYLDQIEAKWVGAYSNTGEFDLITGKFQLNPTAQRYEYGTVSVPLFVGLGASMNFLLNIGMENVWKRNFALASTLKQELNKIGAEVQSPQNPNEQSSIITFKLKNIPYGKLQQFLAKNYNLRTRGIYEGGLNGLRISLHLYNSFNDVDKIIEGVKAAQKL